MDPLREFEKEKKRSHDVAYLLLILAALFATFLFVVSFVNTALQGLPHI